VGGEDQREHLLRRMSREDSQLVPAGLSQSLYTFQARLTRKDLFGEGVLADIEKTWGVMLRAGATTFWEDFDLEWTKNAGRIDEPVAPGKKDLHGDFGAHCYVGFRHSFCHGWAGGPTAWLSKNVLGISPVAPGCAKVRIQPNLGRLAWAEGTYPTPKGLIHVRHEKQADGSVKSQIKLPEGIEQVD
jgi:hypothetical protein